MKVTLGEINKLVNDIDSLNRIVKTFVVWSAEEEENIKLNNESQKIDLVIIRAY